MKIAILLATGGLLLATGSGCKLQEVRNKWKFGSEWQHKGSSRTDQVRYSEEPNLDFKFDNGWTTGVTYRRRDTDDDSGDGENGLWVDFSYPLWKAAKKPEGSAEQIRELQDRIAQLEAKLSAISGQRVTDGENGSDHKGTN